MRNWLQTPILHAFRSTNAFFKDFKALGFVMLLNRPRMKWLLCACLPFVLPAALVACLGSSSTPDDLFENVVITGEVPSETFSRAQGVGSWDVETRDGVRVVTVYDLAGETLGAVVVEVRQEMGLIFQFLPESREGLELGSLSHIADGGGVVDIRVAEPRIHGGELQLELVTTGGERRGAFP